MNTGIWPAGNLSGKRAQKNHQPDGHRDQYAHYDQCKYVEFHNRVSIELGSFDNPENLSPDRHVWESDRIPWYEIHDELPQHSQFSGAGSTEGGTLNIESGEA